MTEDEQREYQAKREAAGARLAAEVAGYLLVGFSADEREAACHRWLDDMLERVRAAGGMVGAANVAGDGGARH